MKQQFNFNARELDGKTLFVTSQYSKNLPFTINDRFAGENSTHVMVYTWEGRCSTTNRPMGRVKTHYPVATINEFLNTGILSTSKLK